jgi:phosphate starvation-inducible PhoH-like protein
MNVKAPTKPRAVELLLSPVNNAQLANLCGALDENLRQIETALDVSIARRGERFTLHGEKEQTARASEALQMFYALARDTLSVDEIQLGLIELINRPRRKESPIGGLSPTLMTRKTELHGRTPRQVEYLKHIQEHDITFGTGPAGTGKTYLAVASAVDAIERELVQRIVLTRPAV